MRFRFGSAAATKNKPSSHVGTHRPEDDMGSTDRERELVRGVAARRAEVQGNSEVSRFGGRLVLNYASLDGPLPPGDV